MSGAPPERFGPAEFEAASNVSRETLARLKLFVSLLEDWNARINLVSAASLPDLWRRHVWDCAQLAAFIPPEARSLVDLGSGAGFPGIVLAAMLQKAGTPPSPLPGSAGELSREARADERRRTEGETLPPFRVVLYESIAKKCRFLEEASHRLGLKVEIRNARIEEARPEPFDIVTARACAPLTKLLDYARPFQGKNTRCLFLKGQSVGSELTEAGKSWTMTVEQHKSRSDPSGVILDIRELRHVARNPR